METMKIQKWSCTDCQRNIICKSNTLVVLNWRLSNSEPICPECQKKRRINLGPPNLVYNRTYLDGPHLKRADI